MIRSARRLALLAVFALATFGLTGCLSHWFLDPSTRLQVENRSSSTIVGIDVVSEDGSSIRPWIRDTIAPGERSRVYEEDWVGTFNIRIRVIEPVSGKAPVEGSYDIEDLEFDGGSEFLVVSDSENGHRLHLEFK